MTQQDTQQGGDKPQAESPKPQRQRRPRWQRWSLCLIVAILLYSAIGFWLAPFLAAKIGSSQLNKLLNREIVIERIRLNPYTFVAEIQGLDIRDPDGEQLLGCELVRVDFAFSSLFSGPWRLTELTVRKPSVRIQINQDYTYNFSDLLDKAASGETDAPSEPRPLPRIVVENLNIRDGRASHIDLTMSAPYQRTLQPISIEIPRFSTEPGQTNRTSARVVNDAGATLNWDGDLFLDPVRVRGRLVLDGVALSDYRDLYQEFVRFELRGGMLRLEVEHNLEFSPTNRLAELTSSSVSLTGLKVGLLESESNFLELDELLVEVTQAEAWSRTLEVSKLRLNSLRVDIQRRPDDTINLVEAARPRETQARTPGTALMVAHAFTNSFAMFRGSTNASVALVQDVILTNSVVTVLDETPDRPVQAVVSDIAVHVHGLSNLPDAAPSATLSLRWQTNGTLQVESVASLEPPELHVNVDLQNWDLSVADAYLDEFVNARLLDSRLSFAGKVVLQAPAGEEPNGSFEGGLALNSLHTQHESDDAELLRWEAFTIEGIKAELDPPAITVDRVGLVGPEVHATLQPDGTLSVLTAFNITNAIVAPSSTDSTPNAAAVEPSSELTSASPESTSTAAAPALPPVRIATVALTNLTVHLADQMVSPPVSIVLTNFGGELRNLSTEQLQQGDFAFAADVQPAGSFQLEGHVSPLDSTEATTIKLTMRGIDLTPTSPYAQRFLAYHLDRGALSSELEYKITQRQLEGANHVILDQLTLGEKVESPDALDVPIKMGLSVLKDRSGRIELKVPVEGSLDDPQFSLGKVISGAFANVFKKVLTAPFSMLGSVFGGGGDDLDRVEFKPGEAVPVLGQSSRLRTVETILYERPGLNLDLIGMADPDEDAPPIRRARLLAELRQLKTQIPLALDGSDTNATEGAWSSADYQRYVPLAYAKAKNLSLTSLIQPGAEPLDEGQSTATTNVVKEATIDSAPKPDPETKPEPIIIRRRTKALHGGAFMMQRRLARRSTTPTGAAEASTTNPTSEADATSGPVPESTAAVEVTPAPPPLPPFKTMETFLLDRIGLTEQDWQELANQRSRFVRDELLKSARVEAARVTVRSIDGKPKKGMEVRLNLK